MSLAHTLRLVSSVGFERDGAGDPARAAGPPPEHSKIGRWASEGEADLLRVEASSLRDVLSPLLVALAVVVGVVAWAITSATGASAAVAVLIGVVAAGVLLSLVSYMRLALSARTVEIWCTPETLEICDGARAVESWRLEDLRRLKIVHDGAPASIAIDVGPRRYRWTVGQLYRHSRLERLVEEMPERARLRLRAVGLEVTITVRRGVLTTESRRTGRRAMLVP